MESNKIFESDFGPIRTTLYKDCRSIKVKMDYSGRNILNKSYPNNEVFTDKPFEEIDCPYKVLQTNNNIKTILVFYEDDKEKSKISIDHFTKNIFFSNDYHESNRDHHHDHDENQLKPYIDKRSGENVYTFSYTGANQSFQVPTNAKYIIVECWGAGGGTQGYGAIPMYNTGNGGGGGYTRAKIPNVAGQTLNVVVGQGGFTMNNGANSLVTFGNGGGQTLAGDANWGSASGGGRSAIQMMFNGAYQDIVTAGGGGAGGGNWSPDGGTEAYYGMGSGGAGGGLTGGNAEQNPGVPSYGGGGGGQGNGGTNGLQAAGTTGYTYSASMSKGGGGAQYGAGGGSGYFGGGYGGIQGFSGIVTNEDEFKHLPSDGLVLWLDAADTRTLVLSGNVVSQWNDKSQSKANAIPWVGSSTYSSTAFNNVKPGVSMNATSLYAPLAAGTFSSGVTMFCVFTNNAGQQHNTLLTRTSNVNLGYPAPWDMYNNELLVGNGTTSQVYGYNTTNNLSNKIGPSVMVRQLSSTTNDNEWLNGGSLTTGDTENYFQDSGEYIYIGSRSDKVTSFSGVMSEIILYNRVLTSEAIDEISSYLYKKWGITGTSVSTTTSGGYWIFGGGGGGSCFVNSTYANSLEIGQGDSFNVACPKYIPKDLSGLVGNGAKATNTLSSGAPGQNGYVSIKVIT